MRDKIDMLVKLKGDYKIAVDGGINLDTIKLIQGSSIAVIGSYITSGDMDLNVKKIKEAIYGWYFIRNRRKNGTSYC